jgi:alkylation response protein AidB-like acyl-CoA dehydrogenase
VRTDPAARKQAGISFLLIDSGAGVSPPVCHARRPFEVNEVWLENVRVPVENRVHEETRLDLREDAAVA